MSNNSKSSIGAGMFWGALFGLIVGQIIAGLLGMKDFALPIVCTIVGAVLGPFTRESE